MTREATDKIILDDEFSWLSEEEVPLELEEEEELPDEEEEELPEEEEEASPVELLSSPVEVSSDPPEDGGGCGTLHPGVEQQVKVMVPLAAACSQSVWETHP